MQHVPRRAPKDPFERAVRRFGPMTDEEERCVPW